MLSFQRLDVYPRAIEFLAVVYEIVADLPRGNADRADLDVCRATKLGEPKLALCGRELLLRIVAMLTAMVLRLGGVESGSGSGSGSGSNL